MLRPNHCNSFGQHLLCKFSLLESVYLETSDQFSGEADTEACFALSGKVSYKQGDNICFCAVQREKKAVYKLGWW